MSDINTKLKIIEQASGSTAVDPKKKFKCTECEWRGKICQKKHGNFWLKINQSEMH